MSRVPCVRQSSLAAAIPPAWVATRMPKSAVHLVIVTPSPAEPERRRPDTGQVHRLSWQHAYLLLRRAALAAELERIERARRRRDGERAALHPAGLGSRHDRRTLHIELMEEIATLEPDAGSREARHTIESGLELREQKGAAGRAATILAAFEDRPGAVRTPEIRTVVGAAPVGAGPETAGGDREQHEFGARPARQRPRP